MQVTKCPWLTDPQLSMSLTILFKKNKSVLLQTRFNNKDMGLKSLIADFRYIF